MSSTIWTNFFQLAGLPREDCRKYASTFSENRIHMDMLADLNKDYLRDMGITRIGDIIAILRQAKVVLNDPNRTKEPLPISKSNSSSMPPAQNKVLPATSPRSTVKIPDPPTLKRVSHKSECLSYDPESPPFSPPSVPPPPKMAPNLTSKAATAAPSLVSSSSARKPVKGQRSSVKQRLGPPQRISFSSSSTRDLTASHQEGKKRDVYARLEKRKLPNQEFQPRKTSRKSPPYKR